jgi:outer membrane protein OmpA-like peptidoglycan-associated protein
MIRAAAAGGLLLLAACSTPSLVLMPDEEGTVGQVALLDTRCGDAEGVVGQANSRTAIGRACPRPRDAKLKDREQVLLETLPKGAKPFILPFQFDSDTLTSNAMAKLEEIKAEILDRGDGVEVQVIGYTDTEGEADYNEKLSLERAQKVLAELQATGVIPADAASEPIGRGERDLACPTDDNVPLACNRRAEVIVR